MLPPFSHVCQLIYAHPFKSNVRLCSSRQWLKENILPFPPCPFAIAPLKSQYLTRINTLFSLFCSLFLFLRWSLIWNFNSLRSQMHSYIHSLSSSTFHLLRTNKPIAFSLYILQTQVVLFPEALNSVFS